MTIELTKSPELEHISLGAVELKNVQIQSSTDALRQWSNTIAIHAVQVAEQPESEALRQAVRQMLRYGSFKASGRSKPAQEYLLRCATQDGALPNINAPVDILNTISLEVGLPISLLSISKCSPLLFVRRGLVGESYAFNSTGQDLNVTDLVVVCDRSAQPDRPVGSPIKDSMAGKIEANDTHLVAIVYAPRTARQIVDQACEQFVMNFARFIPGSLACRLAVD